MVYKKGEKEVVVTAFVVGGEVGNAYDASIWVKKSYGKDEIEILSISFCDGVPEMPRF